MTSNITVWIAALMLVASVALFVAAPLTEAWSYRRRESDDEVRRARLEHERGLATTALRELDFDHAMGKIADDEFRALRGELETRALTAMVELDDRASVAATGNVKACPRCKASLAPDYHFCPLCGAPLDSSAANGAE
ncbi:MAG: c-type cytochrome biogenesis protein CcmI [Steroidobacteraceae bacterium]